MAHEIEVFDQLLQELPDAGLRGPYAEALNELREVAQPVRAGCPGLRHLIRPSCRFERRESRRLRPAAQMLQRRQADAPSRIVHHPVEGDLVPGVREEPKVGQHVLDLAALVEAHAPHDLVGHTRAAERVLERSRLGVGPVQHRHLTVRQARCRLDAPLHFVHDPACLVVLVERLHEGDQFAPLALGPERLPLPIHVLRDHAIRGVQDALARTVVSFEPHDSSSGERLLEVENVLDIRASPTVDRLVVVPDDHEVVMRSSHQLDEAKLSPVRVLVLVDEDE